MSSKEDQEPEKRNGRDFATLKADICRSVLSMQQPSELIVLLMYCLPVLGSIRICVEAGVFRNLAASKHPLSVSDLTQKIEDIAEPGTEQDIAAREEFMVRQLRALTGLNFIDETSPFMYQANALTRTLAEPGFEDGFVFLFEDTIGPHSVTSHMVSWAKDNLYKAPTTSTDGPLQQAYGMVGMTAFDHWNKNDAAQMSKLSALMKRISHDRMVWSAWFPADILFGPSGSENGGKDGAFFMVDVGGGLGHDISAMAARYPERQIRLLVQDQPEVIQEAKQENLDRRIELAEHNFFQPQPVKGADIYFMHKIMHDWPDNDCVTILSHLRDAMAPHSRLFLNDMILPDQGSPLLPAAFDITMLVLLSAKERSETMWTRLISQVEGLSIRKFWQAPELKGEGIVEVVKSSSSRIERS